MARQHLQDVPEPGEGDRVGRLVVSAHLTTEYGDAACGEVEPRPEELLELRAIPAEAGRIGMVEPAGLHPGPDGGGVLRGVADPRGPIVADLERHVGVEALPEAEVEFRPRHQRHGGAVGIQGSVRIDRPDGVGGGADDVLVIFHRHLLTDWRWLVHQVEAEPRGRNLLVPRRQPAPQQAECVK